MRYIIHIFPIVVLGFIWNKEFLASFLNKMGNIFPFIGADYTDFTLELKFNLMSVSALLVVLVALLTQAFSKGKDKKEKPEEMLQVVLSTGFGLLLFAFNERSSLVGWDDFFLTLVAMLILLLPIVRIAADPRVQSKSKSDQAVWTLERYLVVVITTIIAALLGVVLGTGFDFLIPGLFERIQLDDWQRSILAASWHTDDYLISRSTTLLAFISGALASVFWGQVVPAGRNSVNAFMFIVVGLLISSCAILYFQLDLPAELEANWSMHRNLIVVYSLGVALHFLLLLLLLAVIVDGPFRQDAPWATISFRVRKSRIPLVLLAGPVAYLAFAWVCLSPGVVRRLPVGFDASNQLIAVLLFLLTQALIGILVFGVVVVAAGVSRLLLRKGTQRTAV